jgi:hypothetical protein
MRTAAAPRYTRATAGTMLAVATLPTAFLVLAYMDYRSSNWDPQGDSGAVQGFMVIFLAAVMSIGYVAVAFPAAARRLHRLEKLRVASLVGLLAAWLIVASLVFATAASLLVGGLTLIFPLAVILYVAASMLSLPFAPLWLWLAK